LPVIFSSTVQENKISVDAIMKRPATALQPRHPPNHNTPKKPVALRMAVQSKMLQIPAVMAGMNFPSLIDCPANP
jgi:hypothetical protein